MKPNNSIHGTGSSTPTKQALVCGVTYSRNGFRIQSGTVLTKGYECSTHNPIDRICLHRAEDTRPSSSRAEGNPPTGFTLLAGKRVERQDEGPTAGGDQQGRTRLRPPTPASAARVAHSPANSASSFCRDDLLSSVR